MVNHAPQPLHFEEDFAMNGNQECVAYAGHLQAEHRELHQRLRALQGELNNVSAAAIDEPLRERMLATGLQLYEDLANHFREEESGGCMEYAASRVPGLAAEVQNLEHEHPLILGQLRRLIAEVRAEAPGTLPVAEVKQKFDAFVVSLLSHEARENRVVERGFNMSME
jgi:hypothetical protein